MLLAEAQYRKMMLTLCSTSVSQIAVLCFWYIAHFAVQPDLSQGLIIVGLCEVDYTNDCNKVLMAMYIYNILGIVHVRLCFSAPSG